MMLQGNLYQNVAQESWSFNAALSLIDIDIIVFLCKEEEMRRLVAAQRDLHGETSQSDWSEDDEGREGETTDDGGLDHLSMAANGGLTDAEGAMSGKNIKKF